MSKHTKGSWIAKPVQSSGLRYWSIQEKQYNGFEIASTANAEVKEDEANAHLMAAAPELLEACKAVVSYVGKNAMEDFGTPAYTLVLSAIAKAEGGDDK